MPQALEELYAQHPNQFANGVHADYLLPPTDVERAVVDLAARFRAVIEARSAAPVARYATATMPAGTFDPNLHPRGKPENKGQFAPKGQASGAAGDSGGAGSPSGLKGEGFASPNEEENLSFDQAASNARSEAMKKWVGGVRTIAKACGLGAAVRPGIGDWSTGAEQSAEIEFSGAQDYDQLKYTMCVIGRQARQFAVIPFVEDHDGPDSIWEIDAPDNIEHVRSVLDKYQIQHRTLIDMGGGQTKVVIYDPGSQLDTQTDGVAAEYGTERSRKRGHGEFFPGSANDRQHAVEQYDAFIADYEQRHPERPHWTHPGQGANAAGPSNGVHDAGPAQGDLKTRMSQALSRYAGTFVESQHPRGQPENAGEFAPKQVAGSHHRATRHDVAALHEAHANRNTPPPDAIRDIGRHVGRTVPREIVSAAHAYTDNQTGLYAQINKKMRTGAPLQPNEQAVAEGVSKLVDHVGPWKRPATVWRGMGFHSPEQANEYLANVDRAIKTGGTVVDKQITSTSFSQDQSMHYLMQSDWAKARIMLRITAKTGAYFDGLSANPHEDEVVKKPGTRYKPVRVRQMNIYRQPVTVVDLEEV